MLITLNTDGSLDYGTRDNRKAGWAYWISSNMGRFKAYGKCPNCNNTMAPELVAIAKGIYFIRNNKDLSKCTKLIVNTDCQAGIDWIDSINNHKDSH